MKTVASCSYFFLIWLTQAVNSFENRIIGGETAFVGQFPYIAAIYRTTNDGTYFCGGALLDDQWILTSGSCVENAISFTIYLGTTDLKDLDNPDVIKLSTNEHILHPDFQSDNLQNDVGLIKLRMPITFTAYVRPINYLPQFELLPGTPGIIAMGWGQISDDDPGLVDKLRFVYLTPLENEECKRIYGSIVTDKMVCAAGNNNEGFCWGDNGTPLIRIRQGPTSTHMGIASFISQNGCESSDPSGYTRTFEYVDWIRNVTGTEK